MSYDIFRIGTRIANAYEEGYECGYKDGKRDAFKREYYEFEGGSELFTMVGEIGCEVRFRTPSFEKFREVEEACRRVLDGKESGE